MPKNKSTKKPVAKPKTSVVPAVVLAIRGVAVNLQNVPDVPDDLKDARIKVITAIGRLSDRVAKNIANAGKKVEKAKAKTAREAKKVERTKAKKDKAIKKVADLKAKLAEAEKAVTS